jgi:hypothetical protein
VERHNIDGCRLGLQLCAELLPLQTLDLHPRGELLWISNGIRNSIDQPIDCATDFSETSSRQSSAFSPRARFYIFGDRLAGRDLADSADKTAFWMVSRWDVFGSGVAPLSFAAA